MSGFFKSVKNALGLEIEMSAYEVVRKLDGDNLEIRKCLLWSLQFELDPSIRTEACHCIILLIKNNKDQELMDLLQERHLMHTF